MTNRHFVGSAGVVLLDIRQRRHDHLQHDTAPHLSDRADGLARSHVSAVPVRLRTLPTGKEPSFTVRSPELSRPFRVDDD